MSALTGYVASLALGVGSSEMSSGDRGRARNILVVSGRRLIAGALGELLADHPEVESWAVAWDGNRLAGAMRRLPPTTVLVDLDDPGCSPERLIAFLTGAPRARRIGVYDTFTAPNGQLAFELGLTVLVPLTSPLDHVVKLVVEAAHDSSATSAVGLTADQLSRLSSLTPRELEVLSHVARGRSVRSAAALMGVTVHTVDTHKRRCFAKLGVQQQAHAVALATSAGLIPPD